MKNLYNKNGLIFWEENEINQREIFVKIISEKLYTCLKQQNVGFNMVRVEAPLLTPNELINPDYTEDDIYRINDLSLRPETTIGSYLMAKELLSTYNDIKYKPPIVIWQHGKSFRREQDQATKFMRLKEFYQLEFQIIYSSNTLNDYSIKIKSDMCSILTTLVGDCYLCDSERLPDYSEETIDIVRSLNDMEVCSISKRKDLEGYKVLEVAVGTDRLLYNYFL